jgi:hypothetical protein
VSCLWGSVVDALCYQLPLVIMGPGVRRDDTVFAYALPLIPPIALDARIGVDDAAIDRDGGADHVISGA